MRKWFAILLLLTGCTHHKGGSQITFLLPWRAADGNYDLEEVRLDTLSSPFELRGEAAEIYYQSPLSSGGFASSIAHPHIIKSGDVYVPQDSGSAIAVAAYAQEERLFHYEQKLGIASQITWPRKIGVEMNMVGPDGSAHDNAHYISTLDVTAILPYSMNGVPVSLNQGIFAHEHFHAHFQHVVMRALDHAGEPVSSLESWFYPMLGAGDNSGLLPFPSDDLSSPRKLNSVVLRGWNEGLADFFGGTYTRQTDFFTVTLPQLAKVRALDGDPATFWTGSQLLQSVTRTHLTAEQLVGLAYSQGTVLARLMYRVANDGTESQEKLLVRVMDNLAKIPAAVRPNFTDFVMDFETVVPVLLSGVPMTAKTCADLSQVLSPGRMERSFSSCALH